MSKKERPKKERYSLGATLPEEYGAESLNNIAEEMYAVAQRSGFHEKHVKGQIPEDFGAWCMKMVGEISELWEAYRNGKLDDQCDKKGKLSCAEEELADIQIRLMDTAVQLGVNLGRAVARKTADNRTKA